ncbi:MAG: hypothetical protein VKI42_01010 [Synechococcaceae cyanobacterium]|nr:hypothetical protein [Synechococcaceae cyanobacterium]
MVAAGMRRRRICRKCAHKFDTLERVEAWDFQTRSYKPVGEEPEQAVKESLTVQPEPAAAQPKSTKAVARFRAELADTDGFGICLEARPLLVQWWNEARWSKNRDRATWTLAAWEGSLKRVAKLPEHQQVALAKAGVEYGWQALKLEFLHGDAPVATGRPMPTDPAMVAALDAWPA